MFGSSYTMATIKTAEEARKQAEENKMAPIMEKIHYSIGRGVFYAEADLDYLQITMLEELGYNVEKVSDKRYKISW